MKAKPDRKAARAAADVRKNSSRRRRVTPAPDPARVPPPAPAPEPALMPKPFAMPPTPPAPEPVPPVAHSKSEYRRMAIQGADVAPVVTVILLDADRAVETRREIPITDRHGAQIECEGASWVHVDTTPEGVWRYVRL